MGWSMSASSLPDKQMNLHPHLIEMPASSNAASLLDAITSRQLPGNTTVYLSHTSTAP